jgi:hypothetical protein
VRLGTQFKPHAKLGVRLDYHSFWLANKNDGLYNAGGVRTVAAPSGGAADSKIGDEFDATFTVPLTRRAPPVPKATRRQGCPCAE